MASAASGSISAMLRKARSAGMTRLFIRRSSVSTCSRRRPWASVRNTTFSWNSSSVNVARSRMTLKVAEMT